MRTARRTGIWVLQWLLLVPVATRLAMAVQDRRVPGESRPGYYCCPRPDCDQVLKLVEPVPCPKHPAIGMEFLVKELPAT